LPPANFGHSTLTSTPLIFAYFSISFSLPDHQRQVADPVLLRDLDLAHFGTRAKRQQRGQKHSQRQGALHRKTFSHRWSCAIENIEAAAARLPVIALMRFRTAW
jgi:hypothetical protein